MAIASDGIYLKESDCRRLGVLVGRTATGFPLELVDAETGKPIWGVRSLVVNQTVDAMITVNIELIMDDKFLMMRPE